MKMNKQRRIMHRDVHENEILPGAEILTGKAYKQTGKIEQCDPWGSTGIKVDYWLERIKGTEQKAEFFNWATGDTDEYDAAVFEIYIKDEEDQWQQVADGPLPLDEEAWEELGRSII
jgi:hypothetical protein